MNHMTGISPCCATFLRDVATLLLDGSEPGVLESISVIATLAVCLGELEKRVEWSLCV